MEEERLNVELQDIIDFYGDFKKKIEHIPVGFVFNLDETGEVENQDATTQFIVVVIEAVFRSTEHRNTIPSSSF